jgi:hypothetical protein
MPRIRSKQGANERETGIYANVHEDFELASNADLAGRSYLRTAHLNKPFKPFFSSS